MVQVLVLVVSDVEGAARLRRWLLDDGYDVEVAVRSLDVRWMTRSRLYDGIVIDDRPPAIDARSTLLSLRRHDYWGPILTLGLEHPPEARLPIGPFDSAPAGADADEVVGRLRALTARWTPNDRETLRAGDLTLDPLARRAERGAAEIPLSETESALLHVLMTNAGDVVDRSMLRAEVWRGDRAPASNVVEVYVRYLRDKVDRPFGITSIETVRGRGYRLREDGGTPAAPAAPDGT